MKRFLAFLTLSVLFWQTASSQPSAPGFIPPPAPLRVQSTSSPPPAKRFNLDFHGGGPRELVAAIEEAGGKPLNVIIPSQFEKVQIPPMKLTSVTVPDLFEAMKNASIKEVRVPSGSSFPGNIYQNYQTYYAFETRGQGEDAVWYFKCALPPETPEAEKYCRFYQLEDYLTNYKIEDITTAIKTGWAMLGVQPTPELKFHPETKLLIAVGPSSSSQLGVIENVLAQLKKTAPKPRELTPEQRERGDKQLKESQPSAHKKDGTSSEP